MCLFALAPYYKLDKGFFLGFLFKPLGGLRPPRGLNKKVSKGAKIRNRYNQVPHLTQATNGKVTNSQ